MKKALLLMIIAAVPMLAETVYATPKGTTFHKAETCGILSRSTKVFQGERKDAEAHGLHACRSCYSVHKANNGEWGKEVQGKK